jgi:FtsP/CotA-like multicopper oxidase with cupredoxin domain
MGDSARVPRIWQLFAIAAVCAFAGCASAPVSPGTGRTASDLANPPEVRSTGGVASLTLTARIDPQTGAPAFAFQGGFVPPTIRVSPGDTIDLTYVNALPQSTTAPFNMTNLHFHGFSSSPTAPGDDSIDTMAMPGQTLHYTVVVPTTQPPGLYFYHSHAHGETDWQTTSGMTGAIVIEGIASTAHETAGLPDRIIVLRRPQHSPSFVSLARRARTVAAATSCAQVSDEYTTVNGNAAPVQMLAEPGRPQLLRVLNASADAYYDLSVDGQMLHVVSLDGVPIATYPGAQEMTVSHVVVPPASRVEMIVNGPASGAAASLRNTCFESGPDDAPNPSQVLATIRSGTPALSTIAPPGTLAQGTYDEVLPAPAVQRNLEFAEIAEQGKYYLNGSLYDPSAGPMFTAKIGTVEEWTLTNTTPDVHAFHMHQVHFIVLDVDGTPTPPMWRDTVNLPAVHADGTNSVTHVLIDFRNPAIAGTLLFHCHILKHEDGGMMAKILVQ